MAHDVDLFVIGGGSGGVRAARIAAEHGARVAIAEEERWGGTCVVRGCVPKKLMVYASEVERMLADARGQGWTIPPATFDWPTFLAAKDKEIARLSAAYASRLEKAGVRIINGRAELSGPHAVRVMPRGESPETITAANILVATGGRPRVPAEGEWITSDEAFRLERLPERVGIFGTGYIGVEFAHIFAGFGAKVTLIRVATCCAASTKICAARSKPDWSRAGSRCAPMSASSACRRRACCRWRRSAASRRRPASGSRPPA